MLAFQLKLLLAVFHARDIPEFHKSIAKIPYDQLWINYYPTVQAAHIAKETFLNMPQYTHLALVSDDLILTYAGVEKMINNIMSYNLLVHTAVCNVDMDKNKDYFNICHKMPVYPNYEWVHKDSLADSPDLIRVKFNGWTFFVLHRSLVPLLTFNGNFKDAALDLEMCKELESMNVPIVTDWSVQFYHMRYSGTVYTGLKRSSVEMELKESTIMENEMQ